MPAFVNASNVRAYLSVSQTAGTASTQWTDSLIGSNINAASSFLQKRTGRQFEAQTAVTKKFSTHGKSYLTIPDLRSTTAVTLNEAAITADTTYFLLPDRNNSGVFVGIEFPGFRRGWNPGLNTFDINYNHLRWQGNYDTQPNNLSIAGNWGHSPLPDELLQATVVLASWYTLRPDALLGGAVNRLEQGVIFDLSQYPVEVIEFINNWRIEVDTAETVG